MQELKDIIRLLKEEGLNEITVSDGDQRVTVRRDFQTTPLQQVLQHSSIEASSQTLLQPTAPGLPEREFQLTAPLVGTFYLRPSPDDKAFVATGDVVQAGDTVCLIEAMKVMNEIKAESPGRVRQALLVDGAVVEFGQPLFLFERL